LDLNEAVMETFWKENPERKPGAFLGGEIGDPTKIPKKILARVLKMQHWGCPEQ